VKEFSSLLFSSLLFSFLPSESKKEKENKEATTNFDLPGD